MPDFLKSFEHWAAKSHSWLVTLYGLVIIGLALMKAISTLRFSTFGLPVLDFIPLCYAAGIFYLLRR
jgi:hypothetical protein